MGVACSWIAVRTGDKAGLLRHLGLVETGELVQPGCEQSDMSIHQMENGWTIVFAEDFGWASPEQTVDLSRFGTALGIQYEDRVDMEAAIYAAEGGKSLWSVTHANEPDRLLDITGTPPRAFHAIRRVCEAKQAEDDGVDWLAEIPLELARTLSGYSVTEDAIEFVALDTAPPPIAPDPAAERPQRRKPRARYVKPAGLWHKEDCSAIAIRTTAAAEVFDHLGLREIEKMVWPGRGKSRMAFHETESGWLFLVSENIFWATSKRLRDLSRFGFALGTTLGRHHWHIRDVEAAEDGQILWSVPCPELSGELNMPADIRWRLDEPLRQLEQAIRVNRSEYLASRTIRLLTGFHIERDAVPFTVLRRRWFWQKRSVATP